MASDKISGPREPESSDDDKGGGYQFPSLSAEEQVKMPDGWRGEYIRIAWKPSTSGEHLYYAFAKDDGAIASIDESTASSGTPPDFSRVDMAPDWVEADSSDDVIVPSFGDSDTILVLKPSGSAGRVKVRHVES